MLPPHHDDSNVKLTVHLPLVIPRGCGIRVGRETRSWEEGRCLIFDDTFEHEVLNETDGVRVVLFMDVLRPLRFPMSAINRLVIKAIAASPFVTDAKKNHEAWEQRMTALWR